MDTNPFSAPPAQTSCADPPTNSCQARTNAEIACFAGRRAGAPAGKAVLWLADAQTQKLPKQGDRSMMAKQMQSFDAPINNGLK